MPNSNTIHGIIAVFTPNMALYSCVEIIDNAPASTIPMPPINSDLHKLDVLKCFCKEIFNSAEVSSSPSSWKIATPVTILV